MIESRTTRRFWRQFKDLPAEAQSEAKAAYRLFQSNPSHPSLRFKKVSGEEGIYSVRISLEYRALGVLKGSRILWYWIGTHADYDRLI